MSDEYAEVALMVYADENAIIGVVEVFGLFVYVVLGLGIFTIGNQLYIYWKLVNDSGCGRIVIKMYD